MPGTASALMPATAGTSVALGELNKRAVRTDGIACASQNSVASAASCLIVKCQLDSKAAVEQAIIKSECSKVAAGTEGRMESGLHAFALVRVQIGNRPMSMWVERHLVLA